MAQWWIQRETPPGSGVYITLDHAPVQPSPAEGNVSNVNGRDVYEDGYPDDFSGWGDDESNTVQDYLYDCSQADATNPGVSYAATWDGVIGDAPMGLMAAAPKVIAPKTITLTRSSHPPTKRHRPKGHSH